MSLTHGLVSRGYRRRVVQHQNLRLKLPGGLWHQLRGNHYHSFPYRRTLDLREKNKQESQIYNFFFFKCSRKNDFFFFTFLPICPSQTFFRENDAVCPPRTSLTGILLRWMDLTAMGSNEPNGSGPNSRMSFSRIIPRNVVPETTVPTPC